MLVINCNKEVLEKAKLYDKMFLCYRDAIVQLNLDQWKQEDIQGTSCKQLESTKYFLAFLYVLLLYCERKEGLKTDTELLEKYNVDVIKECFGCSKISIDKLFEIAEINLVKELPCDGINTHQVHGNWGIGEKNCFVPATEESPANAIQSILAMNGTKTIFVPSNC